MRQDIHPEYHPVCFVDVATGKKFLTRSTKTSKTKEVIDGVEYYVIICDITSASHRIFTGEKHGVVDLAGRIEKFENKFRRKKN